MLGGLSRSGIQHVGYDSLSCLLHPTPQATWVDYAIPILHDFTKIASYSSLGGRYFGVYRAATGCMAIAEAILLEPDPEECADKYVFGVKQILRGMVEVSDVRRHLMLLDLCYALFHAIVA